jgi:PLP dependent protein
MRPEEVRARCADVFARITAAAARAGRDAATVRLVAVTKTVAPPLITAAHEAGATIFGENYVQEWREKHDAVAASVAWHFIGRVQRNKARDVASFDCVHSIADARTGAAVARAAETLGRRLPILVQVNLAGESTKGGAMPSELPEVLVALRGLAALEVVGLMTMPPPADAEVTRPFFRRLRELRDAQPDADELRELSMGMSGDYEVAIEEGATLVRVGTAIFGPRPRGAR